LKRYMAFEEWLKQSSSGDVETAAFILFDTARHPGSEIVWEYLDQTGDKEYSPNTFLKAARLIINGGDSKQ
jgi:hypothetical protein